MTLHILRAHRTFAVVLAAGVALVACGQPEPPAEPPPSREEAPVSQPAAPVRPAPPAVGIYITNETSGDLTVVDAATLKVVTTIPLGKRPRGIAISPDRQTAYVALSGSPVAGPGVDESTLPPPDRAADGIGVVDLRRLELVSVLPSGPDPEQVAVSHDGARLFVANEDAARLSMIDVAAKQIVETFKVGGEPEGVSIHPRSDLVFVTAEADNAVYVVDPGRKTVKSVPVGPRPRSIAFLPDGSRAYVTSENGASVAVIDTARLRVIKTVDLGKGMRPMGAVASPDGRRMYISTGRSRMVVTIDTSTDRVAGSVEAGVRPWGIAISEDGRTIYTANGPSHDVSVIDVETGRVKSKVTVGKGPWGVALTAAPAAAYGRAAAAAQSAAQPGNTTLSAEAAVTVTGGQIRGMVPDTHPDIIAFKGVPFAAPPVGELRWRPPAPVVAWQGVRAATASGSACAQRGPGTQSEDCLFLNVWAPRKIARPLPVMVWIHGGGFRIGNGGSSAGAPLASKGVVLVTMNYRLGVFGFFPHPALTAESGRRASGNQGLLDMVAGLEWVRDNIASFGGDPKRVTIFGESAGGGAVAALMLVPQAKGLFHRAIAESPYVHGWDRPLSAPARGWAPAEDVGLELGKALGATGNGALAALRAKTTDEILKVADEGPLFRWSGTIWAPNVDGWAIPDDPVAMYNAGKQHRVPLIAGINDNEGSLFRSRFNIGDVGAFESYVRRDFGSIAPEALAQYGVKSPDAVAAGLDHLVHDMFFAGPARLQMRAHARISTPAWLYHFAQVPPNQQGKNFGAHHAAEIAYVFGELTPSTPWTDADRQVSALMMDYWTHFAAAGDPNRAGLPSWPRFDKTNDVYLTLAAAPKSGTGLHRDAEAVFDRFESQRRARAN